MTDKSETKVRVTRIQKVTLTEYVDVAIYHDDADDAKYSLENRAKELVEAQLAAGHDVGWRECSKAPDSYGMRLTAEVCQIVTEKPTSPLVPQLREGNTDDIPL